MKPRLLALLTTLATLAVATADDEQGSFYIENALVHFIKPDNKTQPHPVIMIPGLNLSSYIYLTTPDNRAGWAHHFAEAGYDVYVINDPNFDFSRGFDVPGFDVVPAEGAPPANSSAAQGWQQDIWPRWGFGDSKGSPYPGVRFPTNDFAAFADHYPYLSRSGTSFSQAIAALLEQTGPAILMPHSAAGPQAVAAAKAHPELVTGFVMIEPTGPPTKTDFPTLGGRFMLGIYGDYIASRRQSGRKAGVESAASLFSQNAGPAQVISLPDDKSIKGNTHLMMQDNNNDLIATLIIDWLKNPVDNPPKVTTGDDSETRPARGRPGRGKGKRPRPL